MISYQKAKNFTRFDITNVLKNAERAYNRTKLKL